MPRALRLLCLGLAGLGCSSAPRPAAGIAPGADVALTIDACVPRDSLVDRTLFAVLGPLANSAAGRVTLTPQRAEQLRMALRELLAEWHMPALSVGPDWYVRQLRESRNREAASLSPSTDLYVVLEIGGDGRLRAMVSIPSDLPALDSAVMAAIEQANAHGGLLSMTADTIRGGGGVTQELELRIRSTIDSLRPSVRLGVVRLPQFEFIPAMALRGNPGPTYPMDLRRNNVQGTVVAEFVVLENGRADMRTFRVRRSSDPGFTRAVRDHLRLLRFESATVDGCPVAMGVQMPFHFQLMP